MEKTDGNTGQDNTEQRIMKAAEELFLMNGFARTTTVAIARKAGVTHAMLHYYYRTKEHIFIRVLDRNLTELLASFQPAMKKDAPFWETLESGISTHFDYLMNHPQLPSFIIDTMRYSPELLESYKPRIMATLGRILDFHIAIIREEVEKGRIRKVDPLQLLLDIVTLNLSVFLLLPAARKLFSGVDDAEVQRILNDRKKEIITLVRSRLYGES